MTAPKKLLVALLLVAVGLVFAATGGATGKYTDPSGDNGSAPDLTGVTVSSMNTAYWQGHYVGATRLWD